MFRPPMDPATGVRRIKQAPHEMTAAITGPGNLFVLAHLGIPQVDAAHWSLTIDGLVDRTRTLSFDELKSLPKATVEAVHQCCGSPLEPFVPTRRVANVRWTGVDLATLLREAGIDPRARFLWSYGLDGGEFAGTSCDWFVKDLPVERLAMGGTLVAYELNGAPLPAEHGFPARLVVPGYYGTNSVKWLWRLHLAAERFQGPFTTIYYNDPAAPEAIAAGQPAQSPVWAVAPESVIVAPAPGATVRLGQPVEVWGWAWSFHGIAGVEISADDGAHLARANLEPRRDWAWQRFSLSWQPRARGEARLCARAFEATGASQPSEGRRNAIHTVRVNVV